MKNLKKLVSVIVTVAMLISSFAALSVSAAQYGDVDETNGYYKAINVLSGLGVVKGDEAGNFNPTSDIKRSEMVALVCRLVGEESAAQTSGGSNFADVSADHWAAGYIAWGVDRKIVKGIGDNKFDPDAPVLFQDAVVMVLRALGYERVAMRSENGGYPTGYMKVASQRGVLASTNDYAGGKEATREVIAQVIYNALTAPIVEVSYFAANPDEDEYQIFDGKGKNGELRTVLTYTNEIYKVKATVENTAKTDADLRKDADAPKVELKLVSAYDYAWSEVLDGTYKKDDSIKPFVGATDVADYLGYTVEAYITENDDEEWELLAVVADSKASVSETVEGDFESYAAGVFEYYADEDDARTTEIDVDKKATIYYNGTVIETKDLEALVSAAAKKDLTGDDAIEYLLVEMANSITFMGPKNADYNKIFVTDYAYRQVDSVRADDEYIKLTSGVLDLNVENRADETFIYNLYDAEGNAITMEDIQEDDILNIVAPAVKGVAEDFENVPYMDIYVTDITVTGSVSEVTPTGKYLIEDTYYEADANAPKLAAGHEGIFYITIDGLVYDADAASVANKNYSFIVACDYEEIFSAKTWQMKLFTVEGNIETLDVASSVRVYEGDSYKVYKKSDKSQDTYFATIKSLVADQADKDVAISNTAKRIVTYKLNADGEINELRFPAKGASFSLVAKEGKYNDDLVTFAGQDLDESSKLFVAPVSEVGETKTYNVDEDDLELTSFATMDEDVSYKATLFTFENDDYLGAALVNEAVANSMKKSHLAVVKGVSTALDANDNEVTKYTFVQSGEIVVKTVSFEEKVTAMTVGDVFRYSVNGNDEIVKTELIFDISEGKFATDYKYTEELLAKNDIAMVMGTVVKVDGNKLTIDVDGVWDEDKATGLEDQIVLRMSETEGNTYAQVDVAKLTSSNPANAVKALNGTAYIKESYGKHDYKVIAIIGETERFEDMVQIYTEK